MRVRAGLIVLLLVIAACGDDGDGDTVTPADQADPASPVDEPDFVTVRSDDGELTITAPKAVADEVDLGVRLLDPSEWPDEVAGGENLPGVKIYELEPSGASFDEPVLVTRRLDLANFADLDLGPFDVPLVTLLTQDDEGAYELLGDLTATRIGSSLLLSGSTTHFSPLLSSSEGQAVRFDPGEGPLGAPASLAEAAPDVAAILGGGSLRLPTRGLDRPELLAPFVTDFELDEFLGDDPAFVGGLAVGPEDAAGDGDDGGDPGALVTGGYRFPVGDSQLDPGVDESVDADFFQPLILEFPDDLGRVSEPRAFEVGSTGRVPIGQAPSTQTFLSLDGQKPPEALDFRARAVVFSGESAEPDPTPPPAAAGSLDLTGDDIAFQLEVFHQTFGDYPSNLLYRLFGITLPPDIAIHAFTFDPTAPRGEGRVVDAQEMTVTGDDLSAQVGIECFCPYGTGFFWGPPDQIEPLLKILENGEQPDRFWVFFAATTDVECVVRVTDTANGDVSVVAVDANEGLVVTDTSAFATCP